MLLHTKAKMLSIHKKIEIMDEDDRVVYEVESKAVSVHDTTFIRKADGEEIAKVTKKPISMHETHTIEMASGEEIDIKTEWFHLMNDVIKIDSMGWELHGDVLQHNYELYDAMGNLVASTHRKWVSLHDVYYIDIRNESLTDRIVCVYVTLEKIIRDREQGRMNNN